MRKRISLALVLCMVLVGCGNASKESGGDALTLQENQSLKYGQVTKNNGNELTIAIAKEVSMSERKGQRSSQQKESDSKDASSQEKAEKPASNPMPGEGQGVQGEAPQGGSENGGPPQGGAPEGGNQKGEASQGRGQQQQSKSTDKQKEKSESKQNKVMYQLTGEEETLRIPVGTAVVTSLGTTTTFSRIAAEDTLKLLFEKNEAGEDVVVGVWIVA